MKNVEERMIDETRLKRKMREREEKETIYEVV